MISLLIMLGGSNRALVRLKEAPLRARVYDAVRDAILAGNFNPGDHLRELHLARDLGVSQNTVREALLQLEQTGLVVRTPNKHTVVTRLSGRDICERVAVRLMLEPAAFVLMSRRMDAADRAALGAILETMRDAAARGGAFELAQADLAFHRRIWAGASNQVLLQTLEQVSLPLFAFVSLLRNRRAEKQQGTLAEHEELLALLGGGNEEAIRAAAWRHISTVYREFLPPGTSSFEEWCASPR